MGREARARVCVLPRAPRFGFYHMRWARGGQDCDDINERQRDPHLSGPDTNLRAGIISTSDLNNNLRTVIEFGK